MERFLLSKWQKHHPLKDLEISHIAIDSRSVQPQRSLFFALPGANVDGHRYVEEALATGALAAVVHRNFAQSPKISEHRLIRVDSTIDALQDLAAVYRRSLQNCMVIAICGSCGKTMLKDLLKEIFAHRSTYCSPESFNSQLGVPLSILNIPRSASYAFIEMAATQTGEMQKLLPIVLPDVAVVTNFCKRRYSTTLQQKTVVQEILSVLYALPKTGLAILERNPYVSMEQLPCPCIFWDQPPSSYPTVCSALSKDTNRPELLFSFPDGAKTTIPLTTSFFNSTDHYSIALSVAASLNIPQEEIVHAFQQYTPQTMRTEVWKNNSQVTFINGTYCRSRLSLEASLREAKSFCSHSKKYLLFGGFLDDAEYQFLHPILRKHNICKIFAWPTSTGNLLRPNTSIPVSTHTTFEEAAQAAKESLSSNDTLIIKAPRKIPYDWIMESFDGYPPSTTVTINLAAIRCNIDLLRSLLPEKTRLMVMVKALAYGTDDIRISTFLKDCGIDILGVSYVDEGASLRAMGISQDIFVVHASPKEMRKAALHNLQIGVYTPEQIQEASKTAQALNTTIKVHLHLDTGMHRFGCRREQALHLAQMILQSPLLEFEGIFTHFSVADDPSQDDFTKLQQSCFEETVRQLQSHNIFPSYCHASNSAAAVRLSLPHCNMVRIGLAAYGYHASPQTAPHIPLQPALSLLSRIAGFNDARRGETVSYGRTHIVHQEKARLAILPLGYFDGLHRIYSGKSYALIGGKRAPMVGRICMDYMMVDVTDIPEARVGDQVLLFGEDELGTFRSPDEFATDGGSIVHELITCLGPRIQRLFIYDESLGHLS